MERLKFLFRFLKYLFSSKTRHSVHSPFVYDLVSNVIRSHKTFYAYENIESVRSKMLLSDEKVKNVDFGAGSIVDDNNTTRNIRDIVRTSAKSSKYGQLLFRLVNKFQPEYMLELGTSLGMSTIYQAAACSTSTFYTLEGNPEIAQHARRNFEKLNLKNIELIEGNFDKTLVETLNKVPKVDYVFLDGNHKYKPTLDYFVQCLGKAHNNTVFVFDDIHWSDEMEQAWKEIKSMDIVTVTIDLFFIGLVFIRKEQPKQHFTIRF